MVNSRKKTQGGPRKRHISDEYHNSMEYEKKKKHRLCEEKRRQQESAAVNMLKEFLIRTKKYMMRGEEKVDRMALLSNASSFIHDHTTGLNMMVAVLCSFVANSTDLQDKLIHLTEGKSVANAAELMQCFDDGSNVNNLRNNRGRNSSDQSDEDYVLPYPQL